MHTTTITRYGAGLFALGAVAALAAGCSTAPADAAAPVQDVAAGTVAPAGEEIPGEWDGTVSTERFAPEADGSYLAMVNLHGDHAVTAMAAEDLEETEFLGGADAQCEGVAELDGAAASCSFTAMDGSGEQQFAQVRLVPAGFGNTALLFGVSDEAGAALPVALAAPQGLQSIAGQDVSAVTDEELADSATSAVLMGFANDGELPADLSVTCEVSDGGEHGLCEVTGTPDGGGDGTWYASAQRGYDGDRAAYLFTQLPQG